MKKFLSVLVSVCLIFGYLGVNVNAQVSNDYKEFHQGDSGWGSKKIPKSDYSMSSAGCFITSISILMAYANEDLRDVDKFNPWILAQKMTFQSGGNLVSTSCNNADSSFKKIKDDDSSSGFSEEEAKTKVIEYMNKGYYVVVCCKGLYSPSTHFSPVVGIKDGTPVVFDVAGSKENPGKFGWNDWAKKGITNIDVFESTKLPSTRSMSGENINVTAVENINVSETEKQAAAEGIMSEFELVGMIDAGYIGSGEGVQELPEIPELPSEQEDVMIMIKDDIQNRKFNLYDKLRVVVTFLGICTIMYGILLAIAYLFDRTNNVLEISLLGFLTLGKYRLYEDDIGIRPGSYSNGKMYCDTSCIIKRVAILLVVGFMLVGGYQDILLGIIDWIKEFNLW